MLELNVFCNFCEMRSIFCCYSLMKNWVYITVQTYVVKNKNFRKLVKTQIRGLHGGLMIDTCLYYFIRNKSVKKRLRHIKFIKNYRYGGSKLMLSHEYLCLVYERVEKVSINNKEYYICLADKLDMTGFKNLGLILRMAYTSKSSMLSTEQLESEMLGKIDVYDSEFNRLLSTDGAVALCKNSESSEIPVMLAGLGVNKECYAFNVYGDFLYSKYNFVSIEDVQMENVMACITKDGKRVLYDFDSDKVLINNDIIGIYKLTQNPDNISDLERHFNIKLDHKYVASKIVDYSTLIVEMQDGLYEIKFNIKPSYRNNNPTISRIGFIYSFGNIHKIDNIKTYLSGEGSRINMGLLSTICADRNMYRYRLRGNILDDLGYVGVAEAGCLTAKQYVMKHIHGDDFKDYMIGS